MYKEFGVLDDMHFFLSSYLIEQKINQFFEQIQGNVTFDYATGV